MYVSRQWNVDIVDLNPASVVTLLVVTDVAVDRMRYSRRSLRLTPSRVSKPAVVGNGITFAPIRGHLTPTADERKNVRRSRPKYGVRPPFIHPTIVPRAVIRRLGTGGW